MYISGPIDNKPDFRWGDLGLFPGRGGYVFALQFFLRVLMKKQWVDNRRKNAGKCSLRKRSL